MKRFTVYISWRDRAERWDYDTDSIATVIGLANLRIKDAPGAISLVVVENV